MCARARARDSYWYFHVEQYFLKNIYKIIG